MNRQEGDGQIGLDGQDPTLVKKTLEFLYTGNYTYDAPPEDSETEPVSTAEAEASSDNESETSMAHPRTGEPYFHAQMYAQGGYFQIDALQSKAMERFEESFKMLDTFDRDGFTSAVIEVYSSTEENDRGLRRLLVRLTTDNLHRFRGAWSAILDDDFLESIPSFFRDMCFSAVDMCDELQREAMMRGTRI
jgi:hypothetical protein